MFGRMADLLELKGDNPFKIRAYRRAAENLEVLQQEVSSLSHEDLLDIPGVGKELADKITEFCETGEIGAWKRLRSEFPEGIFDLMAVPGIGPKTVKLLYEHLHITSLIELERNAREGRLRELPKIKEKTEQNILKGLEFLKKGRERHPIGRVLPLAEDIVAQLKRKAPLEEIALAGSLRRWKETVKDIDILATSVRPAKVMEAFVSLPPVVEVIAHGHTKSSIVLSEGLQVDLRVVDKTSLGAALQYFTGSKAHNIRLRELAVKKGFKINEYGIFREKDTKRLGGAREQDIYTTLGLPYIEPELREDTGEIEAAQAMKLPRLVKLKDLRGDLHVHSNWSDGAHSIETIAREAQRRGYEYIAVTDHSKGLGVTGGLTEDQVLDQVKEIDRVNRKLKGFRILKGIEVDIRSDGRLDLADRVLRLLDVVVASVHSGFKQSRDQQTARLVKAMRHPLVTMLAHPTGRMIGEREAYEVDMDSVLATARESGTIMEINAYPLRLDLNEHHARAAKGLGIPLAINTDAHVSDQFDLVRYGVGSARRGWLEKEDVINTLDYRRLKKFLSKKRK
ncbi:MAG: DNA polymerase/3'-5' exonuclease PolX [Thermodesulfobacteriota bacterium]